MADKLKLPDYSPSILFPPGTYELTLCEVESCEKSVYGKPDETEPGYKFVFAIDSIDPEPESMDGLEQLNVYTGTSYGSSKANLTKVLNALHNLKRTCDIPSKVPIEKLYGNVVRVVIINELDDSGVERWKIVSWLPQKESKK